MELSCTLLFPVGIEFDCEDVTLVEDAGEKYFELICDLVRLQNVEHKLVARGFNVISAEVNMRALHTIAIDESDSAKVEKFYSFLQEDESVKQIFDNIEPEVESTTANASS
uniref:TACO1/YebC-like second and third domain-containing protein n=1 Tax=Parascaris univalens TaxID=6257 RepID=A0A915BKD7_PARUN